jgi:hypothetical protein
MLFCIISEHSSAPQKERGLCYESRHYVMALRLGQIHPDLLQESWGSVSAHVNALQRMLADLGGKPFTRHIAAIQRHGSAP